MKKDENDTKKINIAITFYGGVSLAVYEAGVAEEFLRFIQFCKNRDLFPGIPDMGVSVISGASAGGLAAVMMSAALVNSNDPSRHIEEMRRIWFDVADISKLLYSREDNPASLLNNNILEDEIKNFLSIKQGVAGLCEDVKILLTGTNMQGFFDAIPIESEFVKSENYAKEAFPTIRHTEVFKFEGKDIKNAGGNGEKSKTIAKAARITSSFPVAFPPQLTRSPSFAGSGTASFWYFDGGALDNKPLGHAIDHMESSAEGGEWWHFFIEPRPEGVKPWHKDEWGADPNDPPDPSAAVWNVLEIMSAETIYHDLRRIQKMNHQIMQTKALVSDMWEIFEQCADMANAKVWCDKLNENVKTARLHRFLPDYVKCVTMLFYRFIEHKDRIEKTHKKIIDSLFPLNLWKIIIECRLQIQEGETFNKISEEERINLIEGIAKLEKNEKLKGDYEKAAQRVKDAQLLFRQISFWVEDDYSGAKKAKKEGEALSWDTWKEFEDAQRKLLVAVEALSEVYKNIEWSMHELGDSKTIEKIKCFVRLNEAIHAASGLETRESIHVVRIYHDELKKGPLAGARMANFSGFLDRVWRKHDYIMGTQDTRDMLRKKMGTKNFTPAFWIAYDRWRQGQEKTVKEEYRLEDSDIIPKDSVDMNINNLPASKVATVLGIVLRTFDDLIIKYKDKKKKNPPYLFFFLGKIKFHWTLRLSRVFIWLVKQATVQPSCRDGGRDISPMSQFIAGGRRYMGFMLIGIVIGLILSFFLPDIVKDWAIGIIEYIKSIVKNI